MDVFSKFKEVLKSSVGKLKRPGDPSRELFQAIEAADNWGALEQRLVEMRARSRKRQQEIFERLEPLAKQVESKLAEAKAAKIKIMRENLLRQAQGYMKQLEAEDEPAKIHGANTELLTNLIKQVQRARAMGERGVEADAIDMISTHLEEVVVGHEEAAEAAAELEEAGQITSKEEVSVASIEARLASICDPGESARKAQPDGPGEGATDEGIKDLENELY